MRVASDLELFDVEIPHLNPAKNTLRRWIASLPEKPVSITFTLPPMRELRDVPGPRPPHFKVTVVDGPSEDAHVLDRWSVAAEGVEHARYLGAKFFRRRFPNAPRQVWVSAEAEEVSK